MTPQNIVLIGASGFLGSRLAHRLSKEGHFLRLPTRRRERAKHLLTLPTSEVIEADVHDPAQLGPLLAGQDIVINLVGVLQGGRGQPYGAGFGRVHVELPRKIAAAAQAAGVRKAVHVSALKAAADAPSGYLRSKAAGETALRAADLELTIYRPSVIFGAGDRFLNMFSALLRRLPCVLLACPDALFQPVWVEDAAACIAAGLAQAESVGRTYELCGPHQYTLRQLVEYVGMVTGQARPIFGLSPALSYLQAWAMEFLPGELLSRDNCDSMRIPSICASGCALPFGRLASPLEAVAPFYLNDVRPRAGNDALRTRAGR